MADQETPTGSSSLEAQRALRLEKAEKLRSLGVNPWGNGRKVENNAGEVKAHFGDAPTEKVEEDPTVFSVAGRVMMVRTFGKMAFLVLRDRTGDIQVQLRKDKLGEDSFGLLKLLDMGDIAAASGRATRTKTGELTVVADEWTILTKSLRPLPEKWHGLDDVETRYRQRYLDLATDPDVREVFRKRSRLVRYIRDFLDARGFLEVETPMMHPLVSGAAAKPFTTHHNALDLDLYMRIAPELYLKRLVVGGFERVYEINRNFRNEGLSTRHNPEFTMLEFYLAHATYEDLMDLTEELISGAAQEICGTTRLRYQGHDVDLGPGWKRISMADAVIEATEGKISPSDLQEPEKLKAVLLESFRGTDAERKAIDLMSIGELVGALFEEHAEHRIVHPTFVTRFPAAISPLARRNDQDPVFTDRFELYCAGREIVNAFSELNDPRQQQEIFERQVEAKMRGAEETMDFDADYIAALEHGMPPTAGLGMGIDRLAMLLTDSASIRDVILFPLLKPR
ncbi:lysine--tRNA ligase [Vulgatibacter incomptus]|uniref:Lysine--tRNA ligase n=1 Tax=Vulgatibacter incomptus TaxID=1391653 RepID=A0A0K1PAN8_9BACT|nr:lysine--tRNA ligase [Vulgatibacter incomptus]AKU90603.1 Lysyl-tRNA synthetase (class II) [Vulgatibacter incomptus]